MLGPSKQEKDAQSEVLWSVSLRTNKKGNWGRSNIWLDFSTEQAAKSTFFAHTSIYQPDSVFGGIQWTLQSQQWSVDEESQVLRTIKGLALEDIADRQANLKDLDNDLPLYFENVGKAMADYITRRQEEDKAKVAVTSGSTVGVEVVNSESPRAAASLPAIPVTINGVAYDGGESLPKVPQSPVTKAKRGKGSPFKLSGDAMTDASPDASQAEKIRRKSAAANSNVEKGTISPQPRK